MLLLFSLSFYFSSLVMVYILLPCISHFALCCLLLLLTLDSILAVLLTLNDFERLIGCDDIILLLYLLCFDPENFLIICLNCSYNFNL